MFQDLFTLEPEEKGKAKFHFRLLGLFFGASIITWAGGYSARTKILSELTAIKKEAAAEANAKMESLAKTADVKLENFSKEANLKIETIEKTMQTRAATRDREVDSMRKEYTQGIVRIETKVDDLVKVVIDRLPPKQKKTAGIFESNENKN